MAEITDEAAPETVVLTIFVVATFVVTTLVLAVESTEAGTLPATKPFVCAAEVVSSTAAELGRPNSEASKGRGVATIVPGCESTTCPIATSQTASPIREKHQGINAVRKDCRRSITRFLPTIAKGCISNCG